MKIIVLGYRSALSFWSSIGSSTRTSLLPDDDAETVLVSARVPFRDQSAMLVEALASLGIHAPLECVVAIPDASRRMTHVRVHTHMINLPSNSLAYVGTVPCDGEALRVYVVAPELCLVQMGCLMQRHELAELAFEFCGDYALRPDGAGDTMLVERPRVTTAEKLRAYVKSAEGVSGVKRARFAAECAIDGSRSPRESQIALEMTLSHRLGGYGLPRPRLNVPITPTGHARQVAGVRELIPDLYWPDAKVVLEYDSDAFHTRDDREREHDIRKRNAYGMMGLYAISLTRRQYDDALQFSGIMGDLAKRLSCETHRLTTVQQRKRAKLHGFLLRGNRMLR